VNHWMAAKLAARFGADIGLPDLLVAPAQCDRQRDFTRPCRRFVSRHWSGNSRQWAQVEEPGVSPKDESPKGAKAQKIGLEKQAWPAGPAAYRLRVAADRVGVFSASRPRRRARGLPQAPLCRPFPYLPAGERNGATRRRSPSLGPVAGQNAPMGFRGRVSIPPMPGAAPKG
jgi:hypothetical protein